MTLSGYSPLGRRKSTGLEGHRYSYDTGYALYLDLGGAIRIVHSVCIFILLIDSLVFAVVTRTPIS